MDYRYLSDAEKKEVDMKIQRMQVDHESRKRKQKPHYNPGNRRKPSSEKKQPTDGTNWARRVNGLTYAREVPAVLIMYWRMKLNQSATSMRETITLTRKIGPCVHRYRNADHPFNARRRQSEKNRR